MSVSMFIYSICKSRIANANGQHVPFFGHPTIRIYSATFFSFKEKKQVLNKEDFAAAVAKRIGVPPTNTLAFDQESFALVFRDSSATAVLTYNLGNFYAFYSDDPEKVD